MHQKRLVAWLSRTTWKSISTDVVDSLMLLGYV